jgi:antitoxin PrlF
VREVGGGVLKWAPFDEMLRPLMIDAQPIRASDRVDSARRHRCILGRPEHSKHASVRRTHLPVTRGATTVIGGQVSVIGYVIEGSEVRLVNASQAEHRDPVLEQFLVFLRRDLADHPERVAVFPASLLKRAQAAGSGVAIDHDAPVDGAIAL